MRTTPQSAPVYVEVGGARLTLLTSLLSLGYGIPGFNLSVLFGDNVNLYIEYSKVIRFDIKSVEKADYKLTVRFDSKRKLFYKGCIF